MKDLIVDYRMGLNQSPAGRRSQSVDYVRHGQNQGLEADVVNPMDLDLVSTDISTVSHVLMQGVCPYSLTPT